jgi:predicted transcriptional regulator
VRFVQNFTVRTKHLGQKKAVKRICTTNARNTFVVFQDRQMSVEEYFHLSALAFVLNRAMTKWFVCRVPGRAVTLRRQHACRRSRP